MLSKMQFLEVRESFLPVKPTDLRERMLADPRLSAAEREQLSKLFETIAAAFHFDFREKLENLKAAYDPFDPDCHAARIAPAAPPQASSATVPAPQPDTRVLLDRLNGDFEELLLDADYVEMPRDQIVACAEYQSQIGVVVKASFSDYAALRVFFRGMRHEKRTFRPWLTPWRRKRETVHVFSRVAVLVRLVNHQSHAVFLKLFKDVVAEDLEMLLPYVKIQMRMIDRLKIGWSVAGGVGTATWKLFSMAIVSPWAMAAIGGGFAGAFLHGVSSFSSSKARYIQALTASLYTQNLANNGSMLAYLVDAAEMEEVGSLLLAYYILYVERDRDHTQEQLDRRIEEWLKTEFAVDVDYAVGVTVQRLVDRQLLVRRARPTPEPTPNDSVLKVYDPQSAMRRLRESWIGRDSTGSAPSAEEDRLADKSWPPHFDPSLRPAEASKLRRTDPGHPPRPPQSGSVAGRVERTGR